MRWLYFAISLSAACRLGFEHLEIADDAGLSDASPADGAGDASVAPLAVRGDLLYYTFNADPGRSVRDRSMNRLGAYSYGSTPTAGRHGEGMFFNDDEANGFFNPNFLIVPDSSTLFTGNTITIEAWIRPDRTGLLTIFSDERSEEPAVEYAFLLDAGELVFRTNSGCKLPPVEVSTTGAGVSVDVFSHVALTWDGITAVFYRDGEVVGSQPFAHDPCEKETLRAFNIARRPGGDPFGGIIDEFKVSSYAKTQTEIQESMTFDSTTALECGDRVIDPGEACDDTTECCDSTACAFVANDTACSIGTCQDGVCLGDSGRVTDGLVVLYEFDEGAGLTVGDSGGVGTPLDLTISDPAKVTWGAGVMTIDSGTLITGADAKIASACSLSDEVSVEAWVTPNNLTQNGPARIISLSQGTGGRNFTLGQDVSEYRSRVRTTQDGNGLPPQITMPGDATIALTHVVATRGSSGENRVYVNGLLRASAVLPGSFSTWDPTYELALGGEFETTSRSWRGTYHLAAVYCRALSSAEVAQNFSAGSD